MQTVDCHLRQPATSAGSPLAPYLDFYVYVDGASEAERDRGVAAAVEVFREWDVTPWDAALAFFRRGTQALGDMVDGRVPTMSTEEVNWAEVFDHAERAALLACCAGWPRPPLKAYLLVSGRPPQDYSRDPDVF